ncbi:hypothetical protein OPIT5_02165 [Opitutaceae bacterium TAV5]|nr:hypothetical protein OPIT5_02165 [Opitutaceae bacterium TAV5]
MTLILFRLAREAGLVIALSVALGVNCLNAATLELPDRSIHVARPGESVGVIIRDLPAPDSTATDFPNLAFIVKDWLGNATTVPLAAVSADGDTIRARFSPPFLGWMEITLAVDGQRQTNASARTRLVIIPETRSKGAYFRYGLSDHSMTLGGSIREKALSLMDALGVDIAREEPSWHRVKAGPEAPWDFARADRMLADYTARGIEMQAILDYGVPWATTAANSGDARRTMPQMEPWLDYVRTTVGRYKDRIRYWEIWNEPDIGFWKSTTAQYVELFDRTSAEIARIHPDAIIMNGGLAMVSRQPNPRFVEDFITAANPAHWHARAWHDYNTFGQLIARHKQHETLYKNHARAEVAALPSWMNEGGYHTIDPVNEAEQARTIVKKISTAPALGLAAYFVYTTRDSSKDRHAGAVAQFYGLADYDCLPKPAFAAYNRLIAETAHLRYTPPPAPLDPAVNDGLWQHLYAAPPAPGSTLVNADAPHTLVIWREGAGRQSPVWLHWPDTHATDAVDLMGNPVDLTPLGNGTVLNLGNNPVYIHLKGAPAYPESKALLHLPDLLSLVPGREPSELDIRLDNPTSAPLACRVQLAADNPALDIGVSLAPVILAPGANQSLRLPVAIPANAANLSRGQLGITLTADKIAGEITAIVPYEVARILVLEKSSGFSLGTRSDIHNLHEGQANPAMEWKGSEDLSANGQWSVTSDALTLTVSVTDQTHHQPNQRDTLWQADSLQFAFRANDSQTDHLELVLALRDESLSQGWVLNAPEWTRLGKGDLDGQAVFNVTRTGTITTYKLTLPWRSLGYDKLPVGASWRASFIVNDDDGAGRKQWLQFSPGIGDSKDPQKYPLFICRP